MKEEPVGCEKESLMIIKVVSKVLDHLIGGAKIPSSNLGLFVKFQSSYAPEVSVQSYLERIRKYSRCSDACFVMALIYIDRLIETRQLMLSQLNVHRLLVTCVMVAAKFHDDLFYNNSYYAKLGGLPLPELNLLEIDLLKLMNFSLFIDKDAFTRYHQELKSYFFSVDVIPSPVSVALVSSGFGGTNVNTSFTAAVPSSSMTVGGAVKSSVSCPNFANAVAAAAAASGGVEDYRVPTPRNPHDKAGSVNVSNEYYFGGYANNNSASTTAAGVTQDLHSSSESPEFVDGNPYDSPYKGYGGCDVSSCYSVSASAAGSAMDAGTAVPPFTQKVGHQRSCDNVASVMPMYLSPQPGRVPVRQTDRQSSSWHRSAALMIHEQDGGGEESGSSSEGLGLHVDTSVDYDERVYGVYHQQQMELLAAARQQHHLQQLQQQQQQQMLAHQRAAYGYLERSASAGGNGYYSSHHSPQFAHGANNGGGGHQWLNHAHQQPSPPAQQQHMYPQCGYSAGTYFDVPNVVDIHGHYHASFGMHMGSSSGVGPSSSAAPYVTVGGPGGGVNGRYHNYQRQHSA